MNYNDENNNEICVLATYRDFYNYINNLVLCSGGL